MKFAHKIAPVNKQLKVDKGFDFLFIFAHSALCARLRGFNRNQLIHILVIIGSQDF